MCRLSAGTFSSYLLKLASMVMLGLFFLYMDSHYETENWGDYCAGKRI